LGNTAEDYVWPWLAAAKSFHCPCIEGYQPLYTFLKAWKAENVADVPLAKRFAPCITELEVKLKWVTTSNTRKVRIKEGLLAVIQ
jgi:hypothetical protein